MPPKTKAAAATDGTSGPYDILSKREVDLIGYVIASNPSTLSVGGDDLKALATKLGYTNPRSLSNAIAILKGKLKAFEDGDGATVAGGNVGETSEGKVKKGVAKTPKKAGGKGKRGREEKDDGEDEVETKKVKAELDGEEEEA